MSQPATARQISNAPEHSTAYYFIEGLNELGIEHLFCNFGTDHAPTIEALADRQKRGEKVPNVMLCPHENTAAHMAMGYAAVTGRGQAVLVHVDVGTANTANAMHNLFRSRLPVLLMMNMGAMPHDVFMKQLRRFGKEVLPKLQAHQVKRVPAAA